MRSKGKWLVFAAILPLVAWSCLALAFSPDLPGWLSSALAISWAALAVGGAFRSRGSRQWMGITMAGITLITFLHFSRSPTLSRDWRPDQDRTVQIVHTESGIEITNLRNTIYLEDGSMESRTWFSDVFDPAQVERVDYVHELLSANGLVAHGFLSFTFSDGRRLAISVEARRREGQSFSPFRGLFRNYELIYTIGTEPDLIGLRAHVRRNPVYVYPIRASAESAQELFRSMLTRADQLGRHPEFYNTLTNNCVTSIRLHVNKIAGTSLNYDTRILVSGLADGLIHELGLLDFDGSLEEARARFRINDRSSPLADPLEWSEQIRLFELPVKSETAAAFIKTSGSGKSILLREPQTGASDE